MCASEANALNTSPHMHTMYVQRAKLHFGYIFGFGLCGAFAIHVVLNLMVQTGSIDFARVCSILGYCLLPIVLLALFAVVIDFR